MRAAYPGRKIVWVTDSAAYHKITRLALNHPSEPGKMPVSKKDYAAACAAVGCETKGMSLDQLKQWAHSAYHDDPALVEVAFTNGIHLIYQPPSFSECNAIERVWAWAKNAIAAKHPPSTRTFTELGEYLDQEMDALTFGLQDGAIVPPDRTVDFKGLYRSTLDLYRSQGEYVEEFLKDDLNRKRFEDLDRRLDAGRRPKAAERETREAFPSPEKPTLSFRTPGGVVTPRRALRLRTGSSADSVRVKSPEAPAESTASPFPDVVRELYFVGRE